MHLFNPFLYFGEDLGGVYEFYFKGVNHPPVVIHRGMTPKEVETVQRTWRRLQAVYGERHLVTARVFAQNPRVLQLTYLSEEDARGFNRETHCITPGYQEASFSVEADGKVEVYMRFRDNRAIGSLSYKFFRCSYLDHGEHTRMFRYVMGYSPEESGGCSTDVE